MRHSMLLSLAAAAVFFGFSQGALLEYATKLPPCGLQCTIEEIPKSTCKTVSNDTCICSDEGLRAQVQTCLLAKCNRLEAIDVARIEAEACKRPIRKRKVDILAPLAIQITGLLVVPLRLYARWTTMHHFAPDDWIMIVCGIMFAPFIVLGQLAGSVAFGEDIWMVQPYELTTGLKLFFVDESFYLTCLGLTKISALFFYLRIFPNKRFRWATFAVMAYVIVSTTILLFMQIFQCIPFDFNWEGWKGDYGPHHCLDINTLAFVAGGLSISHDILILVLPLPLLYQLNMSIRKKAGIIFMFSLGVFILITSCVRLRYIVLFTRSLNPTWDFTDPLIWSGVEVSVSMIVVCLPAIRTLINRVIPNFIGSTAATEIKPAPKASAGSGYHRKAINAYQRRLEEEEERIAVAKAARLVDKRRKFFSFMSKGTEPNESELELGDKSRGEVRTHIRYGDMEGEGAFGTRRSSIESGIHVQTTTTFHGALGDGGERDKATF
ncbi:CFEM domain-containing protein [Colletotrichum truncatum]|uniref:CFEM domain-containing protein n=1 Tax=Colletotrichum truncatum TaxID=5467 RepID=A0ACC3ZAR7_COLTU|nr:CFEM domain-containing protein [Colletotrichum truncatum]KAF6781037.1 CFEM domain-containing protein [Colletotrichum truncatum]